MDSNLVFTCIFLFYLSWALQALSEDTQSMDLAKSVDTLEQSLAGIVQQANQQSQSGRGAATTATSADSMLCMQKLMPCQPYMHSPSPPPVCCTPLKDLITQGNQCLCTVFDNPALLKTVNLTVDEALAIPKACGIDVDVSVCKNATSPSSAPSVPSTPSNPGPSTSNVSNGSSNDSYSSSSNSNAGVRISNVASCALWFIVSAALVIF